MVKDSSSSLLGRSVVSASSESPHSVDRPHVVIVGGGFAGLNAARRLARTPVRVTLVDKRNHHLFQPLLYQVATAALSPANIAAPIRKILRHHRNAEVILGEATAVDLGARVLHVGDRVLPYDFLVLAAGVAPSYFGHDNWSAHAPALKDVEDAVEIRRRFLLAFESAELANDPQQRRRALTFVIVGAGPTGVEMAGSMAEIARSAISRDFRVIDTRTARVLLVESQNRVLPSFPPQCSATALRHLQQLDVEVRLDSEVTMIDAQGIQLGDERICTANVFWAAGVRAASISQTLHAGADDAGRLNVCPDLTVPGHPEVFVVGDLARVDDPITGRTVPGMAPAAIQMGCYAALMIRSEVKAIRRDRTPLQRPSFHYRDKGMLATIGRNKAVAQFGRISFGGWLAWALWAAVHIFFLIGFRNRLIVAIEWVWMYIWFDRGARLIVGRSAPIRTADSCDPTA